MDHAISETSMSGDSYLVLFGGFDGSSDDETWTFGGGDYSLPVELSPFSATSTRSDAIDITWITESEIENLGFILERREQETDWIEIASYLIHPGLQGQGSATYPTEYNFTDETVEPGYTYNYRLADVSYSGAVEYYSMILLGVSPAELPLRFQLYAAYPNPFNPITTIQYDLPQRSEIQIIIYDLIGREVTTLLSEIQDAGFKSVQWDATNISSGIYIYQIRIYDPDAIGAGNSSTGSGLGFVQTRKMILLK